MKAAFHLSLSLLAAILTALPARAWVPDPGEKVTGRVGPFDRTWHAVEKEEGDAILELLLDPNSFEEPRSKPEDGAVGRIASPTLSLTLAAPERDMGLYIDFWRHTDCDTDEPRLEVLLPDSGQRWRVLDEPARKLLAMFEAWEAADREAFLAEAFPRRYVMGSNRHDGGTLSGVALLCYGNGTQWRTIWEANREAVPDPDRPVSGTELVIPAPKKWKPEGIWEGTVTDLPARPLPQQYVLGTDFRDGGTLSGVARLFYGDGGKWPVIWEANKAAVPDPDYPKPGTVLVIPALPEGDAQ